MAYKLIAIDLDDTLLTKEKKIHPKSKLAVQKAVSSGFKVIVSTGRTRKGALKLYEELELDTLLISSGGAEVTDKSGNLLYSKPVDKEAVKKILEFAYERNIHAQIYLDGELVYRERNDYAKMYEVRCDLTGITMPDMITSNSDSPKVLFIHEADNIPELRETAEKMFPELSIKRSFPMFLEFLNPEASKGNALEFVAKHYGIKREETIAVGDTEIDISMLKFAGLGVAVENADPDLKKAADEICPSNDEGGVAAVIEKYMLEAAHEDKNKY